MKHSLAVVAGLVATFALGATVALYGIGPSLTANATGCFALRPGSTQQRLCMDKVMDDCEAQFGTDNRDNFRTCLKAGFGGELTRDMNKKPAGDTQKLHNAGAEKSVRK